MVRFSSKSNNATLNFADADVSSNHQRISPSELSPQKVGTFRSFYNRRFKATWQELNGYRSSVLCCAATTAVVFIVNLAMTIWATRIFRVSTGLGTIQDGSCKGITNLTSRLHLAINVLSTLLLGASNYAMQCLSSPTRSEIDKAHSQNYWLDIGVPSFRNLRWISRWRLTIWSLLAVSSIPLHLLYNSAVFSTLTVRQFNGLVVSPEFLDHGPVNFTDIFFNSTYYAFDPQFQERILYYQNNIHSFQKLDNKACIETYGNAIISTHSDVLFVSTQESQRDANNSVLWVQSNDTSEVATGGVGVWLQYPCEHWSDGSDTPSNQATCDINKALAEAGKWEVYGYPIQVSGS